MAVFSSPRVLRAPSRTPSLLSLSLRSHKPTTLRPRYFSLSTHLRTKMEVELTAPNGRKWTQPLGLFINNEFVKSSNEQKLASINPTCVRFS